MNWDACGVVLGRVKNFGNNHQTLNPFPWHRLLQLMLQPSECNTTPCNRWTKNAWISCLRQHAVCYLGQKTNQLFLVCTIFLVHFSGSFVLHQTAGMNSKHTEPWTKASETAWKYTHWCFQVCQHLVCLAGLCSQFFAHTRCGREWLGNLRWLFFWCVVFLVLLRTKRRNGVWLDHGSVTWKGKTHQLFWWGRGSVFLVRIIMWQLLSNLRQVRFGPQVARMAGQ